MVLTTRLAGALTLCVCAVAERAGAQNPISPPDDRPEAAPAAVPADPNEPVVAVDPLTVPPAEANTLPSRFACRDTRATDGERNPFRNFPPDADSYSIANTACGLSAHKPMFVLPYTYARDYEGSDSELMFQLSLKQRIFSTSFYFGYSQKSFWAVYKGKASRPFRATDYNPEGFYRWIAPDPAWRGWGADLGIEHESNGREAPQSRSWNRVYLTPFRTRGRTGLSLKLSKRIPEENKKVPLDPKGDDNPDIEDYYGYTELRVQRQIGRQQALSLMLRGHPGTGHGAVQLDYTIPSRDGYLFYQAYVFHGYGETLEDYDDSVTRIGLGLAIAR